MTVNLSGRIWHACELLICIVTSVEAATQIAVARAIPARGMVLSSSPLAVISGASRPRCLKECIERKCQGFNYGQQQCELLGVFLCNGTQTLTARPDYRYYDVETDDWVLVSDDFRNDTDCLTLNRCSPKCYAAPDSTTTAQTITPSQPITTTSHSTTTVPQTTTSTTTTPVPQTTTSTTTTPVPQTTTTTVQTTTSPSMHCVVDDDCSPFPNTDCRGSTFIPHPVPFCMCVVGYSLDPASNSCVTSCPSGYGSDFLMTNGYLQGHNMAGYPTTMTKDLCLEQCESNGICASVDYRTTDRLCFLSSVTKYGNEADWKYDQSYEHFQRNCA